MEYHSPSTGKQARRLLTTLVAICLPMLAATFFTGSFFRAGTLEPGQTLDVASAHAEMSMSDSASAGVHVDGFVVSITDHGFVPFGATVKPGTTVIWSNNTALIQSVNISGSSSFGSGDLLPGKQFAYTFANAGSYTYSGSTSSVAGSINVADAPNAIIDLNIQGYQFQPQSVNVNVGDTVRWTNQDPDRHTVTADNGAFDSGEFGQGGTFQYTFNSAGTFGYFCGRHPGMRGTINVAGGPATSTGTAAATGTATAQATGTAGATGTAQPTTTAGSTGTTTPGATGTGTPQPSCNPTGSITIYVNESGFNPSSATVAAGTRVTWTNNGTGRHRVRDTNHTFLDSDDIYPGQSFSYTFCNPGTVYYEDSRSGRTAVLYVTGSGSTGTPGSTTTRRVQAQQSAPRHLARPAPPV